MNKSLKKIPFIITSLFIFFIHLPFVFAKTIPVNPPSNKLNNPNGELLNTLAISVYDSLHLDNCGLTKEAYDDALKGFTSLKSMGKINNDSIISIVDFTLSSAKKRLFVIDLKNYKILFNTYVAHGRNSGEEYAKEFSNNPRSNKSSLGFYVTKETYKGEHGFSLHLEGEEKGINDNAYSRAIVMHCANYVNENYIRSQGFIGRSLGCPALPQKIYKPVINKIKNGTCLFIYSPDSYYLSHSAFLQQAS
jgi:hypothetical protein